MKRFLVYVLAVIAFCAGVVGFAFAAVYLGIESNRSSSFLTFGTGVFCFVGVKEFLQRMWRLKRGYGLKREDGDKKE